MKLPSYLRVVDETRTSEGVALTMRMTRRARLHLWLVGKALALASRFMAATWATLPAGLREGWGVTIRVGDVADVNDESAA